MDRFHSLWLVPENEQKDQLQSIVNRLAEDNNSPTFTPHLTLIGDVEIQLEPFRRAVDEVFEGINAFYIKATAVNFSEKFAKSVFIEFELDENLKNLFIEISKRTENFYDVEKWKIFYQKNLKP